MTGGEVEISSRTAAGDNSPRETPQVSLRERAVVVARLRFLHLRRGGDSEESPDQRTLELQLRTMNVRLNFELGGKTPLHALLSIDPSPETIRGAVLALQSHQFRMRRLAVTTVTSDSRDMGNPITTHIALRLVLGNY
jgi:hypothetical protein